MAIAKSNPNSPLDIQVAVASGRHTLILSGELDLATAPHLQLLAMNICAAGARELVLDLSKMTFTDSTGVRTILGVQRVCRDHATEFLLTRPQPSVLRIFEIAGLLDELPFSE
jgi:anti-sigma B factor antagonist